MSVRRPWLTCGLLLTLALPSGAQVIQRHMPAGGVQYWTAQPDADTTIIVGGVPGERSVIRLEPRPPLYAENGWIMTLLQAGQPTRTFSGSGQHVLRSSEIVFGEDGAVAVVLHAIGQPAATFRLRASSKLPAGFLHPDLAAGTAGFSASTVLRDGLELRVKLRLAGDGACLDPPAHLDVVPAPGIGAPFSQDFPWPEPPAPHHVLHAFEAQRLETATYFVGVGCVEQVQARVRRHHVVQGKNPPNSLMPVTIAKSNVWPESIEVPVAGEVTLASTFVTPDCASPEPAIAHAFLSSPHATGAQTQLGLDLGAVPVEYGGTLTPFTATFTLPPDVGPGLYSLQPVVLSQVPCWSSVGGVVSLPGALPLRVMEP